MPGENDQETSNASLPPEQEDIQNSERILNLNLLVNVNIGTIKMNLRDVMALVPGAIIEIQKNVEDPLPLKVNNKKNVALGEVVTVGENLGIRVLTTTTPPLEN